MEGLGPRGSFRGSTGPVGDLGRPILGCKKCGKPRGTVVEVSHVGRPRIVSYVAWCFFEWEQGFHENIKTKVVDEVLSNGMIPSKLA